MCVRVCLCEQRDFLLFQDLFCPTHLSFPSRPLFFGIWQLLYPFKWQSVCIPLLPVDMLDAYMIPQPYIIGIETKYLVELTEIQVSQQTWISYPPFSDMTFNQSIDFSYVVCKVLFGFMVLSRTIFCSSSGHCHDRFGSQHHSLHHAAASTAAESRCASLD
jgi:hypothetical protein